ncbi:MAG: hypothetical protein ACI88A_001192 [Paraglaciecola sp.]|jgi:hypothetical protein
MYQKFTKKFKSYASIFTIILMSLFLLGCSTTPPKNTSNICDVFFEKRDWYQAAEEMNNKWGVPIHVPMAIMYQESSFKAEALPPRDYVFFGLLPWGRVSSAYGYSQAKTPTWSDYKRETGNSWADRNDFDDAIDFMGWFINKSHTLNNVSKWDGEAQYLNYHEGWGGYQRKTYINKNWLVDVAKNVNARALVYAGQLSTCKEELSKGWFWRIFS